MIGWSWKDEYKYKDKDDAFIIFLKNPDGVKPAQFLKRICVYIVYNVVLHLILYWLEWKIIVYYPHQIVCVFKLIYEIQRERITIV